MPHSFFWIIALLGVILFLGRRFMRRSTTLSDYKAQQDARLKRMLEESAEVHLSDDEALMPVLAALRDVPLPPDVELRVRTGRYGAQVLMMKDNNVLLNMRLSYSRMAPPLKGDGRTFYNGAWHLRLDNTSKSRQDAPGDAELTLAPPTSPALSAAETAKAGASGESGMPLVLHSNVEHDVNSVAGEYSNGVEHNVNSVVDEYSNGVEHDVNSVVGEYSNGVEHNVNHVVDEYFDELAPFATRVETLIRSLHDRPF